MQLAGQEDTVDPVFSFYLEQLGDGPVQNSTLILGGYDLASFAYPNTSMLWSPVQMYGGREWGYWQLDLQYALLTTPSGTDLINICPAGKSCAGVVDTGTSYLVMSKAMYVAVLKLIVASVPGMTCSGGRCNNYQPDLMPVFHFTFPVFTPDSPTAVLYDFPLHPWDYTNDSTSRIVGVSCQLLIGSLATDTDDMIILGDPFLHTYYSAYDVQRKHVGLARTGRSTPVQSTKALRVDSPQFFTTTFGIITTGVLGIVVIVSCAACLGSVTRRKTASRPRVHRDWEDGYYNSYGSNNNRGRQASASASAPATAGLFHRFTDAGYGEGEVVYR